MSKRHQRAKRSQEGQRPQLSQHSQLSQLRQPSEARAARRALLPQRTVSVTSQTGETGQIRRETPTPEQRRFLAELFAHELLQVREGTDEPITAYNLDTGGEAPGTLLPCEQPSAVHVALLRASTAGISEQQLLQHFLSCLEYPQNERQ